MADIVFQCPKCDKEITQDSNAGGGFTKCPHCESTVAVPMPGIHPGMEIGGFEIIRLLGTGAMGEVWLAHQKAMDRDIALKIMAPELTRDKTFVSRFNQEVKLAGGLSHPNIVTAYHAGLENGIYFLAVEYIDGIELSQRLENEKVIPQDEALKIIREIANALGHAWKDHQILHRDIKPSNIMLDKKGNAKLMDMGISKSLAKDNSLTMTGTILGTPFYMSPEQAKADPDINFASDIYSLGTTLYHLVTGTVPYNATTQMAILYKHLHEPFPSPIEKNPNVTEQCAALLEIMMAKKKEDRQHDWDDVVKDIDLVLAGEFPASHRPDAGESVVMRAPEELDETEEEKKKKTPVKAGKLKKVAIAGISVIFILLLLIMLRRDARKKRQQALDKKKEAKEIIAEKLREHKVKPEKTETFEKLEIETPKDDKPKESPKSNSSKQKEMWDFAMNYVKNNPEKFKLAIDNFEKIKQSFPDSKYFMMANIEISKLQEKEKEYLKNEVDKVMTGLEKQAQPFIRKNEYAKVIQLYDNYTGPYAAATQKHRRKKASEFQNKLNIYSAEKEQAENKFRHLLINVSTDIINGKVKTAQSKIGNALKDNSIHQHHDDLKKIIKMFDDLNNINRLLVDYFKKYIGKKVTVETKNGTKIFKVKKVKGRNIYIEEASSKVIKVQKKFSVRTLSSKEKARRLDEVNKNAGALLKGLDEIKKRRLDKAKKYFRSISSPLSNALIEALENKQADNVFDSLRSDMKKLLQAAEIRSKSPPNPELVRRKLEEKPLTDIQRAKIVKLLEQFNNKYNKEEIIKRAPPAMRGRFSIIIELLEKAVEPSEEEGIQKHFRGEVKQFDPETLEIELIYNFDDPVQLEDWELPQRFGNRQKTNIEDSELALKSMRMGALICKPVFIECNVKFIGYYKKENYGVMLFHYPQNLAFFCSWNGREDAFVFNIGQKKRHQRQPLDFTPLGETITEPGNDIKSYLQWKHNEANYIIYTKRRGDDQGIEEDKEWPVVPFEVPTVQVGIVLMHSESKFKLIHIKGVLERKWFEELEH